MRDFLEVANTELLALNSVLTIAQVKQRLPAVEGCPLRKAAHGPHNIVAASQSVKVLHWRSCSKSNRQTREFLGGSGFVAAHQERDLPARKLPCQFVHPGCISRDREKVLAPCPADVIPAADMDTHDNVRALSQAIHSLATDSLMLLDRPEIRPD